MGYFKMNDQKRIELLYEQVIDSSFLLLDREVQYFDKISKILANLLVYKKEQLRAYTIKYRNLKTLSNFDQMLWVENIPWFFDKNDTSDEEYAINETYKDMITYDTMNKVEVHCVAETEPLFISFKDNDGSVMDVVDMTDKQKVKEAFKRAFIRTLKKWYNGFVPSKMSIKTEPIWYDWREKQIRYKPVTNRLPELEGIF